MPISCLSSMGARLTISNDGLIDGLIVIFIFMQKYMRIKIEFVSPALYKNKN